MNLLSIFTDTDQMALTEVKIYKLKKAVIKNLINSGNFTIAELAQQTNFSIPIITKVINGLVKENLILDLGKIETSGGGRPPCIYGINPRCGFYLGVEVNRYSITIALQNIKNEIVYIEEGIPFMADKTKESLDNFCGLINTFVANSGVDKKDIIGACINLAGRIDSKKGTSYDYFFSGNESLSSIIESSIGIKTYLENDSRAMAFGEYKSGCVEKEQNMIFVNMSWGVGVGIITDDKLYYGKSGYSGEFGHGPLFDNNILCHCGKKGCLETEVSGWALERNFKEAVQNGKTSYLTKQYSLDEITLENIMSAIVKDEDFLAVDLLSKIGEKMGRYLSILINTFNPELVVIGGSMSLANDFLMFPIRFAIKKYALNLINQDAELKISTLGASAGVIGACYIVRERFLEMLD